MSLQKKNNRFITGRHELPNQMNGTKWHLFLRQGVMLHLKMTVGYIIQALEVYEENVWL